MNGATLILFAKFSRGYIFQRATFIPDSRVVAQHMVSQTPNLELRIFTIFKKGCKTFSSTTWANSSEKKHYCSKSQSQNLKKMVTVKSRESAYLSFQKAYKGEMWCLCTMIFGQKFSKLNSRPVYYTRLYGIQKTLFLINPLNSLLNMDTMYL